MRLENLYENFGLASPERQAEYVVNYRLLRAQDMDKPSTWPKVKVSKRVAKVKVELTEEESNLAKLLGIKKKDILALRLLTSIEE